MNPAAGVAFSLGAEPAQDVAPAAVVAPALVEAAQANTPKTARNRSDFIGISL